MTHTKERLMTPMRNFKLIGQGFDVKPMVAAIERNPELWDKVTIRQSYEGSAHADTQCIYIRGPRAFTPEMYFNDLGSLDCGDEIMALDPELGALLRPIINDTLKVEQLGRILIVKLKAGGQLTPHIDEGAYADHFSRFHLCLTGGNGNALVAGDESATFQPNELWWFDHKTTHWAVNGSDQDRIHIIIDAVSPLFKTPTVTVSQHQTDNVTKNSGVSKVEIRESTVDEMLAHAGQLFEEHWDEIALNKQVMVLKPDEERYRRMEQQGAALILAAFAGEQMVGYSVNFVMKHLHYADLCVCSNDLLFVAKEKRTGRLGLQLIKATEKFAKERGARLMLWHAKEQTALATIIPKMGYGVQDIIFSKEI